MMLALAGNRDHSRRLLCFARQMRNAPTDAEMKRWSLLRRRKLGGHQCHRQAPIAGYIVDFCCLSAGRASSQRREPNGRRARRWATYTRPT
jgi:very-short-patch-repair endonuclease